MKKYLDLLKKIDLFEGIKKSEMQVLLSCFSAKVEKYDKKQLIFSEGDTCDKIGILLSGQIKLVKDDFYGNSNIVAIIDEGDLFGETFAYSDINLYHVNVICSTDCKVMFIDYRKVITVCSHACSFHNRLMMNLLKIIANKNLLLNQRIEFTSKRSTREKLLSYLSSEAKRANSPHFIIPLNRQELADYLSVDRSAMSSELSRLKNENILEYTKNNFTLLNTTN